MASRGSSPTDSELTHLQSSMFGSMEDRMNQPRSPALPPARRALATKMKAVDSSNAALQPEELEDSSETMSVDSTDSSLASSQNLAQQPQSRVEPDLEFESNASKQSFSFFKFKPPEDHLSYQDSFRLKSEYPEFAAQVESRFRGLRHSQFGVPVEAANLQPLLPPQRELNDLEIKMTTFAVEQKLADIDGIHGMIMDGFFDNFDSANFDPDPIDWDSEQQSQTEYLVKLTKQKIGRAGFNQRRSAIAVSFYVLTGPYDASLDDADVETTLDDLGREISAISDNIPIAQASMSNLSHNVNETSTITVTPIVDSSPNDSALDEIGYGPMDLDASEEDPILPKVTAQPNPPQSSISVSGRFDNDHCPKLPEVTAQPNSPHSSISVPGRLDNDHGPKLPEVTAQPNPPQSSISVSGRFDNDHCHRKGRRARSRKYQLLNRPSAQPDQPLLSPRRQPSSIQPTHRPMNQPHQHLQARTNRPPSQYSLPHSRAREFVNLEFTHQTNLTAAYHKLGSAGRADVEISVNGLVLRVIGPGGSGVRAWVRSLVPVGRILNAGMC